MTALREGFSDDEIQALVEAHPQGVGERYAGAKASKLRQDIQRIREKCQNDANACDRLLMSGQEAGLPSALPLILTVTSFGSTRPAGTFTRSAHQ